MDLVVYALCRKMINKSIESLGNVFSLKGNLASVDDLPQSGNQSGDLYLVGPNQDGSYDEYYWTAGGTWEQMGSTATGMDGFINENTMYKGADGTGTIENPAEDTILYIVNDQNYRKFIAFDNDTPFTPTDDYNPATKKYVDDSIDSILEWVEI